MPVNTFNAVSIFGTAVKMRRSINPRQAQDNAYPGLTGVEKLDLGLRGQITHVTGILTGADASYLNLAITLFESYYDNRGYTLYDQYGVAWSNVVLNRFMPTSRVYPGNSGSGGYCLTYEAEFQHLT